LIVERDVRGNVHLLGERADVPELLAASDIALAPSWAEPFGRSVVEAMAMGVPTVATNQGGPAEIIQDGRDGLLLPPRQPARWAEAIRGLMDDPTRRSSMGAAGQRRASHFNAMAHTDAVLGIYRDILAVSDRRLRV
jgi:glycosyltransferase involved in cell wall biosynthesis